MMKLDASGALTGEVIETYNGFYAVEMRTMFNELEDKEEFWEEFLNESNTETELLSHSIDHIEDPDEALKLKYELETEDFTRIAGDFIYIDPILDLGKKENPFLDENRNYDIEFGCLHKQRVFVTIELPEGFEIESLPEPKRVVLPGEKMVFYFVCQQSLDRIQVLSEFKTTQASFPAEEYPSLKQLYDHMMAKQSEQIVLKRTHR